MTRERRQTELRLLIALRAILKRGKMPADDVWERGYEAGYQMAALEIAEATGWLKTLEKDLGPLDL